MTSLLIKNGKIVTADSMYVADILCENGVIAKIEKKIAAKKDVQVIDATGKYVFPGFIDPHTHVYLPFMGSFACDNYETGTKAALCGGTTTVLDFVIPGRTEEPLKALETWHSQAKGHAACDYAFHMSVMRFDDQIKSQLREIVTKEGISSFKVFLAYKGSLGIEDAELYHTLKFAKEQGVMVMSHCEHADMIVELQKELVAANKLGPEYHYASRPPLVEADGTHHFCTMAQLLDVPVYIVHLSCEESLRIAADAKLHGAKVWIETLIAYLTLDKSCAERPNFEGAKFVMSPPLRDKHNQEILWNALRSGLISTVATDHAPFNSQQKLMGKDNFCKIPNGLAAIEDRIRLLYTNGVCEGKLDLCKLVDIASTQAAKIFNLFPRKGTIQLGSDADLVVYDPDYQGVISAKTHHMNIDYSCFEGFKVKGRCAAVTVRGNVQVRDGEFVGEVGIGQFVKRDPGFYNWKV